MKTIEQKAIAEIKQIAKTKGVIITDEHAIEVLNRFSLEVEKQTINGTSKVKELPQGLIACEALPIAKNEG